MKNRKGVWLRRSLRVIIILFGLIIISSLIFDHFVQFRKDDKELEKIFSENNIPASIHYYSTHGRTLRYVSVGDENLPTLLFLHGSPGSMSYYSWRFMDDSIKNKFRVYAVDRPGYGYSGFGDPEPSIQKQSEMIGSLFDSVYKEKQFVVVVGGAFGAPIT